MSKKTKTWGACNPASRRLVLSTLRYYARESERYISINAQHPYALAVGVALGTGIRAAIALGDGL